MKRNIIKSNRSAVSLSQALILKSVLTWFMPALTNSRLGSPLGRTGEDGTGRCPCLSRKNSTKALRTRAAGSGGGEPLKERSEAAERKPGVPLSGRSLRRSSLIIQITASRAEPVPQGLQAAKRRMRTASRFFFSRGCKTVRAAPPPAGATVEPQRDVMHS